MTTKSISIKGPGCKFGRCLAKAAALTSGGLGRVPDREGRPPNPGIMVSAHFSAEGQYYRGCSAGDCGCPPFPPLFNLSFSLPLLLTPLI
jgi:hypothetical protein